MLRIKRAVEAPARGGHYIDQVRPATAPGRGSVGEPASSGRHEVIARANKRAAVVLITSLLFAASTTVTCFAANPEAGTEPPSRLAFSVDLEGALYESRMDGRPLFVVFVAAWCPTCTRFRREALTDWVVTKYAGHFRWVLVDIDRNLSVARKFGVDSVPLTLLMNPSGETLRRVAGGLTAAELQVEIAEFLAPEAAPVEAEPRVPGAPEPARSDLIWTPKGYRSASICFSHVGYGPLHLYSQSPFQALRLGIRPRTPSTLGRGQREVRATATWTNTWANGTGYFLDFETLQAAVSFGYGITDALQIEVEAQQRDRFGGAMDPLVQGFHDLLGIDQNGRDQVPRDQFTFDLSSPDGLNVHLDSGDRGTFTRSVQVSLQHNVTCGSAKAPAFSYSVMTRIETADAGDLTGGSHVDLGASVAVARRVKHIYFYGTLGLARFGRNEFRGLDLKDTQYTILTAAEWRFRANQSFLLQYLRTEGLSPDFRPFANESHEVTLGWKWEVVSKTVIEIGLIENLISFDNSPDFGIHAGLVRRF